MRDRLIKTLVEIPSINIPMAREIADHLLDEGYRKSSDVAREIFEEIEKCIFPYGTDTIFSHTMYNNLKKKYESEGADDEN